MQPPAARLVGRPWQALRVQDFADHFTPRQLVALTTFSDLVTEARKRVLCRYRSRHRPVRGVDIHGPPDQRKCDGIQLRRTLSPRTPSLCSRTR